jgi:hypothetical protein
MRAILEKWIEDTGDMGRFPEKLSAITERDRKRILEEDKSWPYGDSKTKTPK